MNLFTMVSGLFAEDGGDKSRIAAQIVSGIGFLGAGAIMHDSVRIRGLTTAAMIWVMAAIGMLCGGWIRRPCCGIDYRPVLVIASFDAHRKC